MLNVILKKEADKKLLLKLFLLYLLAYSAIFRADFNWADDFGRKVRGYHGWLDYSRWTNTFLSNIIHADVYLSDISPLPQIIASLFIAVAGVVIWNSFYEREANWLDVICLSFVGLFPYFMGNICYKYDSVYMALSVSASVIPFLYYYSNWKRFCVLSVICLLIMCTTYQASSGIYPMMVVMKTLYSIVEAMDSKQKCNFKGLMKWLGLAVITYICTLTFFRFVLMLPNSINTFSGGEILSGCLRKYVTYYSIMSNDFKFSWLVLCIGVLILFVVSLTAKIGGAKHRIIVFLLSVTSLVLISFLTFGVYLLLSEHYDARAYLGMGVFASLVTITVSGAVYEWKLNNHRFIGAVSSIVLISTFWCFFTFAFTFGNTLAEQKRYADFRIQMIIDDINDLNVLNWEHTTKVQICGGLDHSPVIDSMSKDYQLLKRLTPTNLGQGTWGYVYFMEYFKLPGVTYDIHSDYKIEDFPMLMDTSYHTIYGDDSHLLIVLKTEN